MQHHTTLADMIARTCAAQGVKRAFGVPGGGSSLDLIEAFARCGIEFVLCRTETGAVLMAAADAEMRNGFGVALATQGPGAASAMNGLAHAALDRAPVLFISDGWTPAQAAADTHQVFDQHRMSSPVVKAASRLESGDPGAELADVLAAMLAAPWGPAHVVLTGENARRRVDGAADPSPSTRQPEARRHGDAQALLGAARRPVLLVGVEARDTGAAPRIAELAERLNCPVFTTYKAKGIVSDASPWLVGHVTGGAAEAPCIARADLIVLCGLDPVELIGKPWPYAAPVLEVGLAAHPVHCVKPAASVHGPLAAGIESLLPHCRPSQWTPAEVAALRAEMRALLAYRGAKPDAGLSPQQVVEMAMQAAGDAPAAMTVDAGAHMFSAMAFGHAESQGAALISNGLATMGFALPAAIARALHAPGAPTIAFTGDGGLMMCAGELATAAQHGARLCVVVFNDGALSLIALKQQGRGMAEAGVGWQRVDFASVARGFGLRAFTARTAADYAHALRQAMDTHAPCLIDVHVDPSGYRAQATALRG
jgi:acetolactate synthase-1/2/3 large subunit